MLAARLPLSRDGGKSMQKSAEGIVAAAHSSKGPNMEGRRGAEVLMDEGDAQRKAEMPEDSRRAAGGTRQSTERERQASAATEENTQPEATKLLEEVLRRENLIEALHRVKANGGAPGNSIKRAKARIREIIRKGRGRSLSQVARELTVFLRGWVNYFRLSRVKNVFEELDQWIRRKLRLILWRQWKTPRTRVKKMIERGIEKARACNSAYNGQGPWRNAGASHMNTAVPAKWLQQQGLMSLLKEHQRLASLA